MSLEAKALACTRGSRALFADIDFSLAGGDALRVSGANGSGKTSMLRLLCGLASPAAGQVCWQGKDIRATREQFGAALVYLGHANGVKDDLLAWENVAIGATLAGIALRREQALGALDELGLALAADLPTRALSQGQRKRVALARLQFAVDKPLWILDEPFTALDKSALAALCATLDAHLARGGIVIYTTHQDVALAARRALELDLSAAAPAGLPC
ncbi:MAG: cytochrome c biogenesis heme-transporting ATPase CcmA [Pseudomonadota bacterium]